MGFCVKSDPTQAETPVLQESLFQNLYIYNRKDIRKDGRKMEKTYIFLADGFEEIEGLTVVDVLRRGGIEVCTVSINGERKVTGSHNIPVLTDAVFEECDFTDGTLFVLPGGMPGTLHLGEHQGLAEVLKEAKAQGKRLAAICAAPSVLGKLGLLKGERAVCHPGFEDQLEGAAVTEDMVEISGQITTSRGMGTAVPFALSLLRQLKGEAEVERVCQGLIWDPKKDQPGRKEN